LRIIWAGQFKKDYRRIVRQGKDIKALKDVIKTISSGKRLTPKHRNHKLSGPWKDCYDCHIRADWILVYKKDKESLTLVRTGSHAELFG